MWMVLISWATAASTTCAEVVRIWELGLGSAAVRQALGNATASADERACMTSAGVDPAVVDALLPREEQCAAVAAVLAADTPAALDQWVAWSFSMTHDAYAQTCLQSHGLAALLERPAPSRAQSASPICQRVAQLVSAEDYDSVALGRELVSRGTMTAVEYRDCMMMGLEAREGWCHDLRLRISSGADRQDYTARASADQERLLLNACLQSVPPVPTCQQLRAASGAVSMEQLRIAAPGAPADADRLEDCQQSSAATASSGQFYWVSPERILMRGIPGEAEEVGPLGLQQSITMHHLDAHPSVVFLRDSQGRLIRFNSTDESLTVLEESGTDYRPQVALREALVYGKGGRLWWVGSEGPPRRLGEADRDAPERLLAVAIDASAVAYHPGSLNEGDTYEPWVNVVWWAGGRWGHPGQEGGLLQGFALTGDATRWYLIPSNTQLVTGGAYSVLTGTVEAADDARLRSHRIPSASARGYEYTTTFQWTLPAVGMGEEGYLSIAPNCMDGDWVCLLESGHHLRLSDGNIQASGWRNGRPLLGEQPRNPIAQKDEQPPPVRLVKREFEVEVWLTQGSITHQPVDRVRLSDPCDMSNPGGLMIVGKNATWFAEDHALIVVETTDCAEAMASHYEGYLLKLSAASPKVIPIGWIPERGFDGPVSGMGPYFLLDSLRLVHLEQGLIPIERGTLLIGWL